MVDSADFNYLSTYHWKARRSKSRWYASRRVSINGHKKTIFMHRQLLGADSDHQVHHLNHNTLDNRRANLQLVTPAEHAQIHQQYRISAKNEGNPPKLHPAPRQ